MRTDVSASILAALIATAAPAALAQDEVGGEANLEMGATEASDIEMGIGGGGSSPRRNAGRGGGGGSDLRLGLQLRLNAINVLEFSDVVGNDLSDTSQVPVVTPGIRLVDGKLFIGAGLGFNSISIEEEDGDEVSRSGFTFSPLASYDLVTDGVAALSLLGWLNLSSLGETEDCDPDCTELNDDAFGWGLNLGAGVRGFISEGLSIGGEFGWGFLNVSADAGDSVFAHGIFGTLLFDASVAL